ncbi:MAG TPA: hypothetical protein VEN28_04510, partial [Burkholderiaceae bacterium]|nr:hypothetical protein [Burkholderiaceae bacterium]
EERLSSLRKRHADALAFLVPMASSMVQRCLADQMPDGVPARKADIDVIDESLWPALLKAAAGTAELAAGLNALIDRSVVDEVAIGVKETNARQDAEPEDPGEGDAREEIEGAMVGRVAWFLCPIVASNALAVEATTRAGRATYFFRIVPADEFRRTKGTEMIDLARQRVHEVCRALVALSFKREPIYLGDDRISTGDYARYRLALRVLSYLGATRAAFVGRAIHGDNWNAQVDTALKKAEACREDRGSE